MNESVKTMGDAQALAHLTDKLLDLRTPAGHWTGQLSASALSTATAISALSFYLNHLKTSGRHSAVELATGGRSIESLIDAGFAWLLNQQNADGGWGDTDLNYSNISTTMLVTAAIHADGRDQSLADALESAGKYVERAGGVEGLKRRYGKDKTFAVPILANCAMAGLVPWSEVSPLPFEAACVPQRFYNLMQLPVVSYAIPALVAIGQCKFINDPPWDPIRRIVRRASINRSLKVLKRMQPASGGYLEAIPLTSFVAMALIESGRADHPVVFDCIRFLTGAVRDESEGQCSWPIDTNLATWGTTLAINALANHRSGWVQTVADDSQRWQQCVRWVLKCQNQTVHPFTGAKPGGWGWTDLSGAVPDADDTPGAMLALRKVYDLSRNREFLDQLTDSQRDCWAHDLPAEITSAVTLGAKWLVDLQNRDQGWPTFCRGWGKLPFDRSGADLTAHAMRALHAWRTAEGFEFEPKLRRKIERSVDTGAKYLTRMQRDDGSWLPLWFGNQDQVDDINPFYGTAKVIQCLAELNLLDTHSGKIGLYWILQNQNVDGGWGGGPSVNWQDQSLGHSSVEETALCVGALLNSKDPDHRQSAMAGVAWLQRAARSDAMETCSPIGFYFAKLWYHEKIYPYVFSVSALASAAAQQEQACHG